MQNGPVLLIHSVQRLDVICHKLFIRIPPGGLLYAERDVLAIAYFFVVIIHSAYIQCGP